MKLISKIVDLFTYDIYLRKNKILRKEFQKSVGLHIFQDADIYLKCKFVALFIQIARFPL